MRVSINKAGIRKRVVSDCRWQARGGVDCFSNKLIATLSTSIIHLSTTRTVLHRIASYTTKEFAGYWESTSFLTDFQENIENESGEVTFYDSGWMGSPLFTVPRDRSWKDFITESQKHGWPSFRDSEVDWDYARVLPGGEMVSVDGSHLVSESYCIQV